MPDAEHAVIIDHKTPDPALEGSGGKARNLLTVLKNGFAVPRTVFVPESAYHASVSRTDVAAKIKAMLQRDMESLRWEEIWDMSLSIRNLFMREPVPEDVATPILQAVRKHLGHEPLAVRSCALGEDSVYSHAGLHDSILNVGDDAELLSALRRVWASLWSDRALLYRREMGLDPDASGMGVLIQAMAHGDVSGVLFTADPTDETRMVIEAASGGAEQVVSDAVGTERVLLDAQSGKVLSHEAGDHGMRLSKAMLDQLYTSAKNMEQALGGPQDVEWTLGGDGLVILQSRPITTLQAAADGGSWQAEDKRPWYLSLTRSFADMQALHQRIETEILPGMQAESAAMSKTEPAALDCEALAGELSHRQDRLAHWREVYWGELIPFAHAVRLFGMLYNDAVAPEDPFEFTQLLAGQGLMAVERNRKLHQLARMIQEDAGLRAQLNDLRLPESGPFANALQEFIKAHGDLACSTAWCQEGPWGVIRLLMSDFPMGGDKGQEHTDTRDLEQRFLDSFEGQRREFASKVLGLARESYRLRDDDNLYLGKIQARFEEALAEAKRRVESGQCSMVLPETEEQARKVMPKGHGWGKGGREDGKQAAVKGWAASMGIARGKARVINSPDRLYEFQKGEVLVCDALDPNMTFVAPLASAIVERRGGMLVHGAIIAREYGIPCVTGIPDATRRFQDGDYLVVDGFRGEVNYGDR